MIFNYRKDVNILSTSKTAMKIAVCLTTVDKLEVINVAAAIKEALDTIHTFCYKRYRTTAKQLKSLCKQIKSSLMKDVSNYIKTRDITTVKAPMMKKILSLKLDYAELLNVAISVARWPEYYLHSEAYLKQISQDLESHLSEINAITIYEDDGRRICPYKLDTYHDDKDWYATLDAQEDNVYEFLESSEENKSLQVEWRHLVSVDKIKKAIDQLEAEINGVVPQTDRFASGFINVVRYIKNHKSKVIEQIRLYINGNATAELFTLSESRSPISDLEGIMQILHRMGFKKSSVPMVLENLFHCQYPTLNIKQQEGQILVDMIGECFTVAPGLGPGYKIRFVYNTHADVQNSITPLANLLQKADKLYDDMEAYNDQLKLILADLSNIIDAYCTDTTGYSDYLHRSIYTLLLKLYGFPDDIIWYVLKVFSMPLLINGKYYLVPFGSMQGCKLLVFLMNHANRLMGIIARKISQARTAARPNAGDDVTAYSFTCNYRKTDIAIELAVFAFFNCPVNNAKTAWLDRDGYFDFCSKYYARIPESESGVFSITGLPPKCVGKQILSINGFAELFKVMDSAGTAHRSSEESFDILYPLLKEDLQDGCLLKNAYGKRAILEEKISAARLISYDLGGIASPKNVDIKTKLKVLRFKMKKILERYTFNASGIFLLVNSLGEEFKHTELFKALGTLHRQSAKDILKIIQIINTSEDEITEEDLNWALGRLNQFERNIIRGESVSRNVSTYHRRTPDRDIDLFYNEREVQEQSEQLDIPRPVSLLSLSMLIGSLRAEEYTDTDNIRRYMELSVLYEKHKDDLIRYESFGNTYYALVEDGYRIRLTSAESDYKKYDSFKPYWDIKDPELQRLYILFTQTDALRLCTAVDNTLKSVVKRGSRKELDKLIYEQTRKLGKALVKKKTKEQLNKERKQLVDILLNRQIDKLTKQQIKRYLEKNPL